MDGSSSTGPCMDVFMNNTSNPAEGIRVEHMGLGTASLFNINNTSSSAFTLMAKTNGTGTALVANHIGSSGNIAMLQSGNVNEARCYLN